VRRKAKITQRDYLFDIDRDVCIAALTHRSVGTGQFIIRQSASVEGSYTISVRVMDVVKHYRMNVNDDKKWEFSQPIEIVIVIGVWQRERRVDAL
jgi:hypothetical protein